MGRPVLGEKLTCTSCAARFYDLMRSPAVCPKCHAVQPPPRPRVGYPASRRWVPPPRAVVEEAPVVATDDDELEVIDPPDDDDDDDTGIETPEQIGVEEV
jgi:hypothetical protein